MYISIQDMYNLKLRRILVPILNMSHAREHSLSEHLHHQSDTSLFDNNQLSIISYESSYIDLLNTKHIMMPKRQTSDDAFLELDHAIIELEDFLSDTHLQSIEITPNTYPEVFLQWEAEEKESQLDTDEIPKLEKLAQRKLPVRNQRENKKVYAKKDCRSHHPPKHRP